MAHTKSAVKRHRQSLENRAANIAARKAIKRARKEFLDACEAKNAEATKKAYGAFCSVLDKSAKRGIITKNNAMRRKARAVAHMNRPAVAA